MPTPTEFYRPLAAESSSSALQGTTLIEKYVYSLPEYRLHERQRRNFIEIHSFNGLLATRKVIGITLYVHTVLQVLEQSISIRRHSLSILPE